MSEGASEEQPAVGDQPADAGSVTESTPPQEVPVSPVRPLRIWPVVLLLSAMWAAPVVPSLFQEMSSLLIMVQFLGPPAGALLIVLWWLLLSRAARREKVLGTLGLVVIGAGTGLLADKTMHGYGTIIAVPWGLAAFAGTLVLLSQLRSAGRTWLALLAALIGFGFWDLVRTDATYGDFQVKRSWRWEASPEDRFLESLAARPRGRDATALDAARQPLGEPEWPSFRGPNRDGAVPGIVLTEDWSARPPRELWRIPIGPGWSSFAVAGNRLFTQEQRGEHEAVVCLDATTGAEIWAHQDKSRFWEAVGGTGPRATPTLSEGKLFALGAEGILNCLDPVTGEQIWQQDIREDAGRKPPVWGFSSSPLVTHDVAIVHAGGQEDRGMLAYAADTGDLRWSSPAGDHSYSSAQLSTVDGKQCVLMLSNTGITFVDPTDGVLLGRHLWQCMGYRVVQPLVLDGSSVLLGSDLPAGTRKIEARWDGARFTTEARWTSQRMSPYFNDYVTHGGYLYGFDNTIFACVDLATGKRKWKKGRYGSGQALLLPSGSQLLIISEDGELVLARATPDDLVELARHRVLDGRTWNHPVLAGNRLYVRNAEEAACFELPTR